MADGSPVDTKPVRQDDETAPEESLGRQAASGVLWLTAQKWVVRATGFVTLVILAHQVEVEDFGVVAAAMSVIPLGVLPGGPRVLHVPPAGRPRRPAGLSTAFWTSVAAGVLLSLGLVGIAPLLAEAFDIPELTPVLRALVLSVVPTVLAAVPLAILRRAWSSGRWRCRPSSGPGSPRSWRWWCALLGGGVWALVSQLVVSQWVIAVLAWRRAGWLPSFTASGRQFADMATFGVKVSGFDLLGTSRMLVENWIISVTLGVTALGLINIAQRLVQVAQELVAASLVPVSTVVFARIRESVDRLRGSYLKALGVAYAMVSPLMIFLVVTAPTLVPLLFTEKFDGSAPPAQALALAGIITLGAMLDHGLFYGLGRPGAWLLYAVVVDTASVATTAVRRPLGPGRRGRRLRGRRGPRDDGPVGPRGPGHGDGRRHRGSTVPHRPGPHGRHPGRRPAGHAGPGRAPLARRPGGRHRARGSRRERRAPPDPRRPGHPGRPRHPPRASRG